MVFRAQYWEYYKLSLIVGSGDTAHRGSRFVSPQTGDNLEYTLHIYNKKFNKKIPILLKQNINCFSANKL